MVFPTDSLIRASRKIDAIYTRLESRLCDGSRVPVCLGIEGKIIATEARLDRDELCRLSLGWLSSGNSGLEMFEGITDRDYTARERERLAVDRVKAQALPCPFHLPEALDEPGQGALQVAAGDCLLGTSAPLYSRLTPDIVIDTYRDLDTLLDFIHPRWRLLGFLPTYLAIILAPNDLQELVSRHLVPDAKLAMFSLEQIHQPTPVY